MTTVADAVPDGRPADPRRGARPTAGPDGARRLPGPPVSEPARDPSGRPTRKV
ncbi:hypothetical protein ACIQVT_30665 [Streptomyces sp. NPDC100445]|uniref:hypothetical protein n=1 Tax=Streptomyces sp. NPDC100445 TaxID=3366102 RepID=UPI0038232004